MHSLLKNKYNYNRDKAVMEFLAAYRIEVLKIWKIFNFQYVVSFQKRLFEIIAANSIMNNSSLLVIFYLLCNSPWGISSLELTENVNSIPVGMCIFCITLSQELHLSISICIS